MTRCKEFYDKWEKSPNWCEKCPDAVKNIDNYILLTKELENCGISKETTNVGLSENAARPLFKIKDPIIKEKAIEKIKNDLNGKQGAGRGHKKKLTSGDITKIINKIKEQELPIHEKLLLENEFDIILADPPWKYDFSSTTNRDIENKYPTMELEAICNLKIPSAPDCVLFIWATAPKLREALKVIEAWGFEYKTNAVWDKKLIGMGYYFRGQHELLLVAQKGNLGVPLPENRPASVIVSKREEHSKKPEIVYEIIERMYPDKKYFEMFARNKRYGWTSWGNEL